MFVCDKHTTVRGGTICSSLPPVTDPAPPAEGMRHLTLRPSEVTLVVAHYPCIDGFASAYIAQLYNPRLKFALVDHVKLAALDQMVAGEHVLFLDIAPKFDDLKRWRMASYAILDHHKSAREDLADLPGRDNIPAANKCFDMSHSGCALAWQFFFPHRAFPEVLRAIELRDLFAKGRDPKGDVTASAFSGLTCCECWSEYVADPARAYRDGMVKEGPRLLRVAALVHAARPCTFEGRKAWIVQCDDPACLSDTGHGILDVPVDAPDYKERAEGIALLYRAGAAGSNLIYVSMRSQDDTGPDLSVIAAKRLTGGGHPHAAGFCVTRDGLAEFEREIGLKLFQ